VQRAKIVLSVGHFVDVGAVLVSVWEKLQKELVMTFFVLQLKPGWPFCQAETPTTA